MNSKSTYNHWNVGKAFKKKRLSDKSDHRNKVLKQSLTHVPHPHHPEITLNYEIKLKDFFGDCQNIFNAGKTLNQTSSV